MKSTVAELLTLGKGILAADESLPSIEKRFKPLHIPSSEENRRAYRDMLFTTPGLNEFIRGVILEEMILKSGMVLSGADCPRQAGFAEVAEATRRCFLRAVPAAVPGIVFLSGGQSDAAATERLNAICGAGELTWRLTFSFGRALQAPALNLWKGSPENVAAAQAALHHRARCNGLALRGEYSEQG
jgi:fructose-bisphosphate aldolase class 1